MTLVGQLAEGGHAGAWAWIADLAAQTPEELSAAESEQVRRATKEYRVIGLRTSDGRFVYRYASEGKG